MIIIIIIISIIIIIIVIIIICINIIADMLAISCGVPSVRYGWVTSVAALTAAGRRATKEGQWVLRTLLHIRALVFLRSAWFSEPWLRSQTPFPLCHGLVRALLTVSFQNFMFVFAA